MCAKGLKRGGYCVFGYREYNSLIKGGHSSFQLDVSPDLVQSSATTVDLLVCFNHHGLERNLGEVNDGGVVIHQTSDWVFDAASLADLTRRRITVIHLPVEAMLTKLKAKSILGNVLITAVVWALLGRVEGELEALVREQFGHKKDLLEANLACIAAGFAFAADHEDAPSLRLPAADPSWQRHLLVTGSQAMGLGAVHAGVRLYAGYPMTPSSPLLTYIASIQNETGMVIKQAEDEITAAQIVSGAMHAGARALTATAGGGFDLMSETVSLNGLIENPTVFVLAQRPGPATGLPTWTAQGDLWLAIHAGHGEFARCVLAVSDAEDAFRLMPAAFNLAEAWQTPVVVLTDKQIAEALYTEPAFEQSKTPFQRGRLVTDTQGLATLKATDRFDPTAADGVSVRWLPGSPAQTYCAQADEHGPDGTVDESAANAIAQMEKRQRKLPALKQSLPEPDLFLDGKREPAAGEPALDVLLIGWGSTKPVVLDCLEAAGKNIGYLHVTYLWPLKTERLLKLAKNAKRVVLIEGNHDGQLGQLIARECGLIITDKILKYDGRPFFRDELLARLQPLLSAPKRAAPGRRLAASRSSKR
jgi:2-oxoglutarate ferredoxin oxidoreductase subunit alpha